MTCVYLGAAKRENTWLEGGGAAMKREGGERGRKGRKGTNFSPNAD